MLSPAKINDDICYFSDVRTDQARRAAGGEPGGQPCRRHQRLTTTFVISATCALIKHGELLVANLGDSRAVASVGGTVKQLTQALELAQNI